MALKTHGTMAVDWEQRIDFDRLRRERLTRAKVLLARSEMGALLCFDMNNVRYLTATHIGTWAQDKVSRFALLTRASDGEVVPVGCTIAWILLPGESVPEEAATLEPSMRTGAETAKPAALPPEAAPHRSENGRGISPKVRRLARERGVDLREIRGSGPDGAILASDIPVREQSLTASSSGGIEPLGAVARLMAERTTQGWTSIPHFFLVRELDAFTLVERRKSDSQAGLTYTDLLVALVARVLKRHPLMNASWTGEGVRVRPVVNIGVAVAVKDGVVSVVIPNPDARSVREISVLLRGETGGRGPDGCIRPTSPAPPFRSATSVCTMSMRSARWSARLRRRCSRWDGLRPGWFRSMDRRA